MFEIKSRYSGSVLFSLECGSMKLCVEAAAKRGTNLYGADLGGADLGAANLYAADLSGANLSGADLSGANLSGANLGKKVGKLKGQGYFATGPLGSRNDTLQAFHTDKGIFVKTGCFFDSLEAFRAAVIKTRGEDSKHGKLYLGVANLIEYKFGETE